MAKIIEAKAVLSGEDKLSPTLERLGKKLEQLGKNGKTAEAVDKVAASLGRVRDQVQAIEKFNAAKLGFAGARQNFRDAELAVERAARAMKSAEGPTRQLEAAYRRAQSAVSSASAAFERQKGALLGSKHALEQAGIPLHKIASEQQRLAAAINHASAALDRQQGKIARFRQGAGRIGENITPIAGPGLLHVVKKSVMGGADIQSSIVRMRAAGIPEAAIQEQVGASAGLAAKYPNVDRAHILDHFKELRSILKHPDEAPHLLEPVVRAHSALNAMDRSGKMAEGLQFAVKGAEVLGLAQDPKRFTAYLESFIKAQQVMGKTITPEQMFEFAKYSKASGATLSDRFKMTTALSLSQEMGGSTTGVSVDQFVKQITGGFQGSQHSAAKEFVAMGLADKTDFQTTKTGEIKGMKPGRRLRGSDLDPDEYVYKYLLPAMEEHGLKDQKSQLAQVRRMFPSGRAADLVSKLITQRESFENHAKLYEKAEGTDATITTNRKDPYAALNSLTTSLENFAATVTSPAMERAAQGLSNIADVIGRMGSEVAKWQKENPKSAEVGADVAIGGASYFGIKWTYGLLKRLLGGGAEAATKGGAASAAGTAGGAIMRAGRGGAIPLALGVLTAMKHDQETEGQPLRTYLRSVLGIEDDGEKPPGTFGGRRPPYSEVARWPDGSAPTGRGEISGSAEINSTIAITPSPDFLLKIDTQIKNGLRGVSINGGSNVSGNGPGSLGKSSPDAEAYPRGAP